MLFWFTMVIMRYSRGYAAAGQSLYESEMRTGKIGLLMLFGWLAGIIGFFVIIMILGAAFGYVKKAKPADQ